MKQYLLDCTLRDGGYVNNWEFNKNFARSLYKTLAEAGVDYMEIGFLSHENHQSGLWRSCDADTISELRSAHVNGPKIALMINYGEISIDDVPEQSQLGADMIRIATPHSKAQEATEFAVQISNKGYETTINYMAISNFDNFEVINLLKLIQTRSNAIDFFYVADSFGSLLPHQTKEIFTVLSYGTSASLGFHPHNNLQLAFANSLEAISSGASIVDGSIFGMGRGGGNLCLESYIAYLETISPQKYQLAPVLKFADLFMEPIKKEYSWGYSLPQLISGIKKCHPNYPNRLLDSKRYTADEISKILNDIPQKSRNRFDPELLSSVVTESYNKQQSTNSPVITENLKSLADKHKSVLILCGGYSIKRNKQLITDFITENNCFVVSVNNDNHFHRLDAVFYGNTRRIFQHSGNINNGHEIILGESLPSYTESFFDLKSYNRIPISEVYQIGSMNHATPLNSGVEAIYIFAALGFKSIHLAGMDGYPREDPLYFYNEKDAISSYETLGNDNKKTERELNQARNQLAKKNASFQIITPTIFKEHNALTSTHIQ